MQSRIADDVDLAELAAGRDAVAVGLVVVFIDDTFAEHRLVVELFEHGSGDPAVDAVELELHGAGNAAVDGLEFLVIRHAEPDHPREGQGPVSVSSG